MRKVLFSVVGALAVLVVAAGLGVGCAGPAYVAGRRVAPVVPPDLVHSEARFEGKGGLKLFSHHGDRPVNRRRC